MRLAPKAAPPLNQVTVRRLRGEHAAELLADWLGLDSRRGRGFASPKGSAWRVMQFDTLRLRLIKIAARVVELKTQIKIHLPSSAPDQAIFGIILNRLPRLVT